MPNLLTPEQLSRLPAWIGDSRVTLGLDLKGGSHLALEVDADALVSERLEALAGEARQRLAEAGVAAEVAVVGDPVRVTAAEPARRPDARRTLAPLPAPAPVSRLGQAQPEWPPAADIRLAPGRGKVWQ